MPRYTVESPEGKRVTFEWNDPTPPTDADMEEVFASVAKPAEPEPAQAPEPKSLAVKTADLIRPELSDAHPTLSALGNVGADLAGGFVGMGENLKNTVKAVPQMLADLPGTARGIVQGIRDNPATAAASLVPYVAKKIPGVGLVAGAAGQAIDQSLNDDTRPLADRFGDVLTAVTGNATPEALKYAKATKVGAATSAGLGRVTQAVGQSAPVAAVVNSTPVVGAASIAKKGTQAIGKTREAVQAWGDEKLVHALNPTKDQARDIARTNKGLGKRLREDKAVPYLGSPEAIQENVLAQKKLAGQELGKLIKDADAELTARQPLPETPQAEAPKLATVKGEELRPGDRIVDPERGPATVTIYGKGGVSLKFDQPFRRPGWNADIWTADIGHKQLVTREGAQLESIAPKAAPVREAARPISAHEIAIELEPIIKKLETADGHSKTPGKGDLPKQLHTELETLRRNGKMTLEQANELRQEIDDSINFSKRRQDLPAYTNFLMDMRNALNTKLNAAINGLDKGHDALKLANRKFSDYAAAAGVLEKSIPRGLSNQSFSLGDKVAGTIGAGIGGTPGAIVAAGANKATRKWGNAMGGRLADRAANMKAPKFTGLGRVTQSGALMSGPEANDPIVNRSR
jgi:hypothetical protein